MSEMSHADSNKGKKRHLPPWMLGVTATNLVSISESEVKIKVDDSEVPETTAGKPKSRALAKKHAIKSQSYENESEKTNSYLLKRCKTYRSKRKLDRKHNDGDNDENDREKENYASRKKRKAIALKEISSDDAVEESNPSEDKLTVEDLVSIAKEHIENAEKDEELSSQRTGKLDGLSSLTTFSKDEQIHNHCNAQFDDRNSVRHFSTSDSHSDFVESRPTDSRSIVGSPRKKTGDPTQDMLDLFLGPLLRTSKNIERKADLLLPDRQITLNYDLAGKQSRAELGGQEGPVIKKKSSLKDKVAAVLLN